MASRFEGIIDARKASWKSVEYFLTAMALSGDKFWVNLNPNEKNKVIDPLLADTDFGRIMLAADLRLKEDFSELTNPEGSPIGREFWRRLYEKAAELGIGGDISTASRLEIVPGDVVVYEQDNRVYLVESRLRVGIEAEYLKRETAGDKRETEFADYAADLMQELILPFLNLKVNEGYSYADLRQAYSSLVLARWYKEKFSPQGPLIFNVDFLKELSAEAPYTAEQIYQDYLKLFRQGGYSLKESSASGAGLYGRNRTVSYTSGGIDLTRTRFVKTRNPPQPTGNKGTIYFTCGADFPVDENLLISFRDNLYFRRVDSLFPEFSAPLIPQSPFSGNLADLDDYLPPLASGDFNPGAGVTVDFSHSDEIPFISKL